MFILKLKGVLACWILLFSLGSKAEICDNAACKDLANTLHNNMDPSIEPCEDFYQFACGGYIKKTKIPEDEGLSCTIFDINKAIEATIRGDLESKSLQGMPPIFQKAVDFYGSCINTAAIERRGLDYIKELLKSYGGWPLVDPDWKEDKFDWIALTKVIYEAGQESSMILNFNVECNERNVVQSVFSVNQPDFGETISIDRFYLVNGTDDPVVKVYHKLMLDMAMEFGANKADAEGQINDLRDLEIKLAKITELNEDLRDHTKVLQITKIGQMQEKYPYLNWLYFFTTVFGENAKITQDDLVQIHSPVYLEKLGDVLKSTNKRTLANYIIWQVVYTTRFLLTSRIEDISQELKKARFGLTKKQKRQNFCVILTKKRMSTILAIGYVKKHFDQKSVKIATEVIELVRKQFLEVIAKVDFLDPETREKALDKVKSIQRFVGFPDEFMDETLIEKYFEKLSIDKSNFYQNVLNTVKFDIYTQNSWLHKPYNASSWEVQAYDVVVESNAYYNTIANAIVIYAGNLQSFFFNVSLPFYLNVATLGPTTIGHELSHSVDDQGADYDKYGNLKNWWDESTKEKFKKKAQEIIDVYSTYVVKEVNMKLNGENTVGEVIADQVGYKLGYMAFEEAITDIRKECKGQELGLIGFEKYTPEKLFWIIAATGWCATYRPEVLRLQVESNVHPPQGWRVTGPFMNSELFSRTWKCPVGSKMNPEKKVNVW